MKFCKERILKIRRNLYIFQELEKIMKKRVVMVSKEDSIEEDEATELDVDQDLFGDLSSTSPEN